MDGVVGRGEGGVGERAKEVVGTRLGSEGVGFRGWEVGRAAGANSERWDGAGKLLRGTLPSHLRPLPQPFSRHTPRRGILSPSR